MVVGATICLIVNLSRLTISESAMPTYTVTACVEDLTQDKKLKIAQQITQAHHGATGAQRFFAEVIFRAVDRDDFFIGGKPLRGDSIFIHGHIRAGRTSEQKHELMMQIVRSVADVADVPTRSIWIYINDIPPELMVEFGYVLPQPGEESWWLERLSKEDREHLLDLDS